MTSGAIGDLKMDGIGTVAGGVYRTVNINGVCKVDEDIAAQKFDVKGRIRIRGNLTADELDVDGTMSVGGALSAERASFDGVVTIEGGYAGQQLRMNGMLEVGGDCEADVIEGEGAFKIGGLLNAGTIRLKLQGRGSAREIGGETICIGKGRTGAWHALWKWMVPGIAPELKAGVVEGDDIELDHATADIVRGDRVAIGPGCVIGRVEYQTELRKHPSARIGEEARLHG
ncbi:hypothetical protein [Cohnella sp. JJ-181]|uniref:hypothetical protein n=1 Tax=Cohnella rhizoplanae TaxID=2974897 RepID=UPI0022FFBBC5|nr:hypothetical protein [Cohnella sp. JJ-181]CAI6085983.1 hypothetical protein COHCIP112018_04860 [Cohnella sp. JJ-181]